MLRQLARVTPQELFQEGIDEPYQLDNQADLRKLWEQGLLEEDGVVGIPRRYRIARVMDIEANVKCETVKHAAVRFPSTINLVQYHDEPLDPLALVGSFDLPPPQIAVRPCEHNSARPVFELTPEARRAVQTRELRFTDYTWGPCYVHAAREDDETLNLPAKIIRTPVAVQLGRIRKYVRRGFRLRTQLGATRRET